MNSVLRIILITALWYGAASALLIFVFAPWLHTGIGYPLKDSVTLPQYQKRAIVSAAIGYPLLCAVLIAGNVYGNRKPTGHSPSADA